MGHLLNTVNPEAAAAIGTPAVSAVPLPQIGDLVIFYPRPGELRAGRGRHAAIVTAVHEDERLLDLVVIYDADDFIGQRRVPCRSLDGGMGWEPRIVRDSNVNRASAELAALCQEIAALRVLVFGGLALPSDESVLGILDEHEDRIEVLEKETKAKPKHDRSAKKKSEGK